MPPPITACSSGDVMVPVRWLRLAGLWMDARWPPRARAAYAALTATLAAAHSLLLVLMVVNMATERSLWGGGDEARATLLDIFNAMCVGILNSVKVFPFIFAKRKVAALLHALGAAEALCGAGGGGVSTPLPAPMAAARRAARMVSWLFLMGAAGTWSLWQVAAARAHPAPNSVRKPLPIQTWLPFSTSSPPGRIAAHCLVAALHGVWGTVVVCTNAFYWAMLQYARAQFQVLSDRMRHMSARAQEASKGLKEVFESEMDQEFRVAVQHHQSIFRFVEILQELLGSVIFTQYLLNLALLVILSFTMTMNPQISQAIFLCFELAELALFCLSGDLLIEQSQAVGDAAFACGWQDCSPLEKSALPFMLMRTQRAARITALGFSTLSLQLFASLLQAAYSYYAVIREVQDT